MRRFIPVVAVAALVVVLSGSADAGVQLSSQLAVSPNPATTTQAVTIANAPGAANTCEGGEVFYSVVKTDGEGAVAADTIEPDPDGNWTVTIDPIPVAGTFIVSADCTGEPSGTTIVAPLALADFTYADVELVVTQAVVPSSSTTQAPAASTRPSFTG
jgi:hypothetical protein